MSYGIKKSIAHGGSRPGSGRPTVEEKRLPHSIKFSDAEWEEIKSRAAEAGITASEHIRRKALEL